MKFLAVASAFLVSTILSVSAQLTAPMKNYNVTSPVTNGPYVAGQILPCTYRLFPDVDSSMLHLQITLEPATTNATANSNNTLVITDNADVSKTAAFEKQDGNVTYYEHSINYNIPTTLTPGNYEVVFTDTSTNTQLPVPIEIRPAEASTSSSASQTGSSSNSGESSIFAGAPSSKDFGLTSKTLLALAAVAGIAVML